MKNYLLSLQFALIAIFLLAVPTQVDAQLYEILEYIKKANDAREHIGQLKEGTLIVRLISKRNNIEAIEKALTEEGLNTSQRKRLELKLAYVTTDRDRANLQIIKGLKEYYQFSDYRIVYDADIYQLFNQVEKGYFLNHDLKVDPSISIDLSKPFYVLGHGYSSISDDNNREGLIFTDQNNNDLEGPFPHIIIATYPPFSTFIAFFGAGDTLHPNYTKMIKRANGKLNRLYTKSRIKEQKNDLKQELKELKDNN